MEERLLKIIKKEGGREGRKKGIIFIRNNVYFILENIIRI